MPLGKSFQLGPREKVKAKGLHGVMVGRGSIDLSQVEQLVDESQTRAIAAFFKQLSGRQRDRGLSLSETVDEILEAVAEQGLDHLAGFDGRHPGYMALPRKQEICAAVNRYRGLRVSQS